MSCFNRQTQCTSNFVCVGLGQGQGWLGPTKVHMAKPHSIGHLPIVSLQKFAKIALQDIVGIEFGSADSTAKCSDRTWANMLSPSSIRDYDHAQRCHQI